ncbi:hypothetical protein Pmani_004609 [Petrolisthes manimaculis]|uniref:C-type lectin domain-containing protein n=1 Tax=Petrolisthes manimaculis TaxID=1843537 RepID=A0AAE1UNU5_9EUCA|nr:hypothetical protein Pmani_004609 [Petrolisthes manimaculis]
MCHSLDSDLCVVNTATRLKNIIDYINNNGLGGNSFWISGSDEVTEGMWTFPSGHLVPMGTPFWAGFIDDFQEPNNAEGNEDCLSLYQPDHFYLNDKDCEFVSRALCELPNSTTTKALRDLPRTDCPSFFVGVGGLCLSFMTWADQTWAEARQSCHGLGGELADLTDIEDLRAIYLYLHQEGIASHSFWLGGSDEAVEDLWIWTDGTPVPRGVPFWGITNDHLTIEPEGGSSENCLLLNAEGFHYFRDASCDSLMNPLCKI